MGIVAVTKVFNRGQTHIPADIRRKLKLKDGDRVVWYDDGEKVYIKKA